jgi:glyoxylase-like metal-dependent hydrolase (beta-lactamase superfamily II)
MLFRQLFDHATWTYTYLIADEVLGAAVLVDPVLEQVDRDLDLLRDLNLTLTHCLETHVHADHITGTARLREVTGCQGIVPEHAAVTCADRLIKDGEVLQVGSIAIEAIATPGHTDSHMAFLVNGTHLLTGDSLFIRGCGRTDFQSGDPGIMYDSLQRLLALPPETWVYPGHDYQGRTLSTIGEEQQLNPRLMAGSRDAFVHLMNHLNLPDPQKIMEAVPANQQCGRVPVTV